MPTFARLGLLMPIDDYLKSRSDLQPQNFLPGFSEYMSYAGQIYGLPNTLACNGLLYRPSLFTAAGYADAPFAIRGWEEFALLAKRLTIRNADNTAARVGFSHGHGTREFLPWLYANGSDFIVNNKAVFANRQGLETLNFMRRMMLVDQTMDMGGINNLLGGKSAVLGGHNQMIFRVPADMDAAFTSMPPGPSGTSRGSGVWYNAWAIPKGAKNPDLAFELMGLFTSAKGARAMFSVVPGQTPARVDFYHSAEWLEYVRLHPIWSSFAQVLEVSRGVPATMRIWDLAFRGVYTNALNTSTIVPEQALNEAQMQVNGALTEAFKQ